MGGSLAFGIWSQAISSGSGSRGITPAKRLCFFDASDRPRRTSRVCGITPAKRLCFFDYAWHSSTRTVSEGITPAKRLCFFDYEKTKGASCSLTALRLRRGFVSSTRQLKSDAIPIPGHYACEEASFLRLVPPGWVSPSSIRHYACEEALFLRHSR